MSKTVESFPTIEECVQFLKDKGCVWDNEKQEHLNKMMSYTYKEYWVLYDPFKLLN